MRWSLPLSVRHSLSHHLCANCPFTETTVHAINGCRVCRVQSAAAANGTTIARASFPLLTLCQRKAADYRANSQFCETSSVVEQKGLSVKAHLPSSYSSLPLSSAIAKPYCLSLHYPTLMLLSLNIHAHRPCTLWQVSSTGHPN